MRPAGRSIRLQGTPMTGLAAPGEADHDVVAVVPRSVDGDRVGRPADLEHGAVIWPVLDADEPRENGTSFIEQCIFTQDLGGRVFSLMILATPLIEQLIPAGGNK